MGRLRALVISVAMVLCIAAPAAAQTPDTTPETVPDTTTTTEPAEPAEPPVTLPGGPPDTIPAPPAIDDPGLHGDAPSEPVPQSPETVPDRPVPDTPGAVARPRARVVQVDVRSARASALARQAAYDTALARRQQLEAALADLEIQVGRLEFKGRQAVRNLTQAHDDLVQTAINAYVRGPEDIEIWGGPDEEAGQRSALISAIADRDQAAIERYEAAKARVTREQAQTATDLTDLRAQLDLVRVEETQAALNLNSARLELAVTTAGGNIVIHGFVFPVASPHSFRQDFGDPRNPGTPLAHAHEGCDVAAAEGTELYAAERGVITQLSSGGLGGTGLWLKGESGTYYYYAHLSAYVLGLQPGLVVEAGQLVGYVGHTGSAYGPHLHFEVHPNGGAAIDPYPMLLAADPQQLARP